MLESENSTCLFNLSDVKNIAEGDKVFTLKILEAFKNLCYEVKTTTESIEEMDMLKFKTLIHKLKPNAILFQTAILHDKIKYFESLELSNINLDQIEHKVSDFHDLISKIHQQTSDYLEKHK